jgi:hypothetical protein
MGGCKHFLKKSKQRKREGGGEESKERAGEGLGAETEARTQRSNHYPKATCQDKAYFEQFGEWLGDGQKNNLANLLFPSLLGAVWRRFSEAGNLLRILSSYQWSIHRLGASHFLL